MPLTAQQCKLLDQYAGIISEQLDLQRVIPYLKREKVFTRDQAQQLQKSDNLSQDFFSLLKMQSFPSFTTFYKALVISGCVQLADLLKPALTSIPWVSEEEELPSSLESSPALSSQGSPPNKVPATVDRVLSMGLLDLVVKQCESRHLPDLNDTVYANFSHPKGLALIINNAFRGDAEMLRDGTEVDAQNMALLLTKLDYKVHTETDLTAAEMRVALKDFAGRKEHERHDSAIVVLLSHGNRNEITGVAEIMGVDHEHVKLDALMNELDSKNCPFLLDKPKLFFVQACRGDEKDSGFLHLKGAKVRGDHKEVMHDGAVASDLVSSKIPISSDMFLACSSSDRYVSWRHTDLGSWFIRELCWTIAEHGWHKHIGVSEYLIKENFCQMPQQSTTHRKQFFFFPGVYVQEGKLATA